MEGFGGTRMAAGGLKKDAALFGAVFLFSIIIFHTATWCESYIYRIFARNTYLTWHLFLEVLSIAMSSAIFFITFYTFGKTYRLRSVVFSCTFLAVALIDIFHTLSYDGMPLFLTESSVAKATGFWIVARLTAAVGLLIASLIPWERKMKLFRFFPASVTLVYTGAVLYIITWHLDILPPLFIEGVGLTKLKITLEYVIIAIQIVAMLVLGRIYLTDKEEKGNIYIIIALMLSVFSEMAFTLYTHVYDTYNLLGHIYKILAYYALFRALFVINVQKPYLELYEAEQKISEYADNLERLVENRTREIAEANERIISDLDYARNIQLALLPTSFPRVPTLEFASKYLPCEKVGGDFYNIYRLDEENIGILIGDVSGHGVSAAMITVFINQNIYVRREFDDGHIRVLTPRQVLNNLYYIYNRMSFPDEIYTVIFYGIYNITNNTLVYASAGMNTSPLILDRNGGVKRLEIEGLPICRLGTLVNPSYENRSVQLEKGDALIFFTDGLTEIDRHQPEIFSEENIMEFIKGMRDVSAKEIVEDITDAYYTILGDRKMLDDVTILVAKTALDDV
jgi:sigma-B regulation protein RsbU (phosphoserine phosphatase)